MSFMNPFMVGQPVRGNHFYGRDRELRTILTQPWTWICGPPRLGTTSLLFRTEEEACNRGYITLVANLDAISQSSLWLNDIYRQYRRHLRNQGIDKSTFEDLDHDPVDSLCEFVTRLASDGSKVMFLWNEADKLLEFEEQEPNILMRLALNLRNFEGFRFVIAARQGLTNLFEKGSEFLSFFHYLPLSGLEARDAIALLSAEHTGGLPHPPTDDVLREAVNWSGGHPLILQYIGMNIAEGLFQGEQFDYEALSQCYESLASDVVLVRTLEYDFSLLTPMQQEVLRKICQSDETLGLESLTSTIDGSRSEIEDAVRFLTAYGYITFCDQICLRFLFYKHFLPPISSRSETSASNMRKVRHTIFISYSHKDIEYLRDLKTVMTPLTGPAELEVWDDKEIESGQKWEERILQALERANRAVLLISPDFLASKFVKEVELPLLLRKSEAGEYTILCIHVRHSAFDSMIWTIGDKKVGLRDFQALNSPDRPLSRLKRNGFREETLVEMAKIIASQIVP